MLWATEETWRSGGELEVVPCMLGLNSQGEDCQSQALFLKTAQTSRWIKRTSKVLSGPLGSDHVTALGGKIVSLALDARFFLYTSADLGYMPPRDPPDFPACFVVPFSSIEHNPSFF